MSTQITHKPLVRRPLSHKIGLRVLRNTRTRGTIEGDIIFWLSWGAIVAALILVGLISLVGCGGVAVDSYEAPAAHEPPAPLDNESRSIAFTDALCAYEGKRPPNGFFGLQPGESQAECVQGALHALAVAPPVNWACLDEYTVALEANSDTMPTCELLK